MSENNENDKSLEDFLDDALKDFDATSRREPAASAPKEGSAVSTSDGATAAAGPDEFFIEQAKMLAARMNTLFDGSSTPGDDASPGDTDKFINGFQQLAQAAAKSLSGENQGNPEEVSQQSASILQALQGLQDGADSLRSPLEQDDIHKMFDNLRLNEGGEGGDGMFMPFFEDMMQSMLCAEVLMPTIKELCEKYPKYLAEHGDKISAEDKERYEKQYELYKVIEGHLEQERPDDTPEIKREKFRVVFEDMRKLQEYGQPPEEILEETGGELPNMGGPGTLGADAGPQCPMQ